MKICKNCIHKNTKDEDWLRASMRTIVGSKWIEDIAMIGTSSEFVLV